MTDSFPVQEPALRTDTIKATVNRTLCPLLQELGLFEAMTTTMKKVAQQTNQYKIFYGKRGTRVSQSKPMQKDWRRIKAALGVLSMCSKPQG